MGDFIIIKINMENIETWLIIIIETIVIVVVGTLLHFAYEWTHENKFIGIFAAVNESTWEHVKLALSGMICCMLVDIWFLGDNPNYWLARSVSLVMPVLVIPAIFYGYQVIAKRSILAIDIGCFIVAAFASAAVFAYILQLQPVSELGGMMSMVASAVVLVVYLMSTRFPMRNFLFQDPRNHRYGYAAFRKLFGNEQKIAKRKSQRKRR